MLPPGGMIYAPPRGDNICSPGSIYHPPWRIYGPPRGDDICSPLETYVTSPVGQSSNRWETRIKLRTSFVDFWFVYFHQIISSTENVLK